MRYYVEGRIIYSGGYSPRVGDPVVGMMDTPELATLAAAGMNALLSGEIPSTPTPAERLIEGTDFRLRAREKLGQELVGSPYLDHEDRRRIAEVLERNRRDFGNPNAETQTLPAVDPRYGDRGRSV